MGLYENTGRSNVKMKKDESIFSTLWGTTRMFDESYPITNVTKRYYPIVALMNAWLTSRLSEQHLQGDSRWCWSSITVNNNLKTKAHRDKYNFGPSIIREFGSTTAGLRYWNNDNPQVPLEKMLGPGGPLKDIPMQFLTKFHQFWMATIDLL